MGKILDLLTLYADYRDIDPFAETLREHFPGAYVVRNAILKRLQGLKVILGVT